MCLTNILQSLTSSDLLSRKAFNTSLDGTVNVDGAVDVDAAVDVNGAVDVDGAGGIKISKPCTWCWRSWCQ